MCIRLPSHRNRKKTVHVVSCAFQPVLRCLERESPFCYRTAQQLIFRGDLSITAWTPKPQISSFAVISPSSFKLCSMYDRSSMCCTTITYTIRGGMYLAFPLHNYRKLRRVWRVVAPPQSGTQYCWDHLGLLLFRTTLSTLWCEARPQFPFIVCGRQL